MMSKKLLFGILAISIVAIAGWYLLSSQTEVVTPEHHETEESETSLPPAWQLMTESVFLWENGKEKFLAGQNSDLSNFLLQTLHKLNLQARCVFSEEHIQEIKQNNNLGLGIQETLQFLNGLSQKKDTIFRQMRKVTEF